MGFGDRYIPPPAIPRREKGAPNGVATLDPTGKIPSDQIPLEFMEFLGNWDASTNTPTLANTDVDKQGNTYRVSVAGSVDFGAGAIAFELGDWCYNTGTVWQRGDNSISLNEIDNSMLSQMAANTVKSNPTGALANAQDLAMPASTILARLATGNIVAATIAQIKALITYTKTVNLNIVGKGVGASKTTTDIVDNSIIEKFSIGDELYFEAITGYDYESGDLNIIIDFCNTGGTVGKETQWQIDYLTHDIGDVISGTTGTISTGDIALSAVLNEAQTYTFTIPGAQLKEEIHYKITRIAINDGIEPASDPAIIHTHVRYLAKLE